MNASIHAALQEARRRLNQMYGQRLARVVLYGSQARGDALPESDVDVLVILQGPVDVLAELKRLTDLKLDLMKHYNEYVSFQPFSEEDYQDRGRPLMMNVHAEGIEL